MATAADHWEHVYRSRPTDEVSWFQADPVTSVRLVRGLVDGRGSVLDVGGGASRLVDVLLEEAAVDVTVLDVSAAALDVVRERLGDRAGRVTLVQGDLLAWEPARTYDVWHDRAVLHFLTRPQDRARYADLAAQAVVPGGALVVATFAEDGPEQCSGLPVRRCDAAALATLLAGSFDLVHDEREEHVTPAGVVQPFTWAVLRRR